VDEVVWSGTFVSGSGQISKKTGKPLVYPVALYGDGSASCQCVDFIVRGQNSGNLKYRCKHIRQAAAEHPEWSGSAAGPTKAKAKAPPAPVPVQPVADPKPAITPLDPDDLERRTRRRI
jgi:hypothetical protein